MSHYTHTLTEIEQACGVTLDEVAQTLPKVLVRDGLVHLPQNTPPALAGSVARAALAGPVEFVGIGKNTGYPIYQRQS
ncbi:hypothetical protein SEA_SKOG_29 [Gordonia phage Skog]|uniref:Uncharacterized protein n=1 Tax=Gordonia phage Skog TaxID=2704033 RepID=A0A6G6XJ98_9CAUD|nr:hypothetical protein KHQ85_gp029 [Gordonia phage Skog]QIG58181.1 hypothetical protein SEA_SKOG_29 [Gordonia phage Skog]